MWRGLAAVSVSCVISAGVAPVAWSAPAAPNSADTPVADGAAEPTTASEPLSSAQVHQPGASVAATSGSSITGVPSRVVPTGEARMVGLTWPGAAPQVVEVRSQNPDGSWTNWVHVDAATEENGEAKGSEPVWIGASKNIEVKAARDGQDAGGDLTAVLIEAPTTETEAALDSNPSAGLGSSGGASIAGGASTAAALPVPVISRAAWGANESWRSGSPSYHGGVRAATIHHTATTNNYTRATSAAQVRAFYSYHTRTLGWSDIGYNALVDKYGQVFEGRAGGLDRPVMGAHAGGFNRNTFGIAMIGSYDTVAPPSATVENVSKMIAWKFRISGITSGRGTTRIVSEAGNVKYARGTTATLPRIFAHRDVGYTSCPGNAGYAKMETFRARVTALLGSSSAPPAPSAPPVQVNSMASGASVASSDGAYVLRMQGDGNLVLYTRANRAVWSSKTYLPGGRLLVQGDGNVVLVDASGRPRWHTNSAGRSGARFMLQSDGNLVLYSGSTPVWDRMWRSPGRERRHQTDFTVIGAPGSQTALTGAHAVVVQRDGNLVVYAAGNRPVWATNTRGSGARLRLQGDGNLVLTNGAGQVMWHSGTFGRPGARAVIADDGKLSVYHGNARVWAS